MAEVGQGLRSGGYSICAEESASIMVVYSLVFRGPVTAGPHLFYRQFGILFRLLKPVVLRVYTEQSV